MSSICKPAPSAAVSRVKPLPLAALVLVLLAGLTLVAWWADWSGQRALMRYCTDPELALRHLEQVMTEVRPAGDDSRLPYLVAAKLLFLLPRHSDEPVPAYLDRVARRLRAQCR